MKRIFFIENIKISIFLLNDDLELVKISTNKDFLPLRFQQIDFQEGEAIQPIRFLWPVIQSRKVIHNSKQSGVADRREADD